MSAIKRANNLTFDHFRLSRVMIPELVFVTPGGQTRVVEFRSKYQLLRLLTDLADALARLERFEEIRRAELDGDARGRALLESVVEHNKLRDRAQS